MSEDRIKIEGSDVCYACGRFFAVEFHVPIYDMPKYLY